MNGRYFTSILPAGVLPLLVDIVYLALLFAEEELSTSEAFFDEEALQNVDVPPRRFDVVTVVVGVQRMILEPFYCALYWY